MTMVSFRVSQDDADAVEQWATRLGVDRSELLRDALRRQLVRLAAEGDASRYDSQPLTAAELSLADVAEWGPAEDWSDWADATG